jgi:glycosyltransferase involved in cell wall biosynthesis
MNVTFVVPIVEAESFTGGQRTIIEYANGLVDRGHDVSVVPLAPSARPSWIDVRFALVLPRHQFRLRDVVEAARRRDRPELHRALSAVLLDRPNRGRYLLERARQLEFVRDWLPDSDVMVATSYETALAVHLFGSGQSFYFGQHFEPLFSDERSDPGVAHQDALLSYRLGLSMIANSSWLAQQFDQELGLPGVPVCPNAIDHSVFYPATKTGDRAGTPLAVISYGGRQAVWKGFEDAAKAVAQARRTMPDLRWLVFGHAALPPDNPVARYEPLGFLSGSALRDAYVEADMLLAPAWYESFPLYPLEAMACGVPVITTPHGVEEYAIDGESAIIVAPRQPAAMAEALVRVGQDAALRARLAETGARRAREFTWSRSVDHMAELLGLS